MDNVTSFLNKYKALSQAELSVSENLAQDLADVQKEVALIDDAKKEEFKQVLVNISYALEVQMAQLKLDMTDQRDLLAASKKNEQACIAYLQSAHAKPTGKRR
tara:strand:+ start:2433 stop:2741 length:309 start_codon:yes stop_codon:yes gene_type:complete